MTPRDSASRAPLVSVVTPVRDGERFIEQTIRSVLSQDYPHIEYIVADGGSTDRTPEILARYRDRITIVRGPDAGQADALNRGFALAGGDILGWLNADDLYAPGAVATAVRALEEHPTADVVYGAADHVDDEGRVIDAYPVETFDAAALARRCIVCQPAAFVRRLAMAGVGGLDPRLHYALDYDLWIRLSRTRKLVKIDDLLAHSRMHHRNKTLGFRREAYEEIMAVLRKNYGYVPYEWIYGYTSFLIDKKDQYFEASARTPLKVLLSLPLGISRNPLRPVRFIKDWLSHRSFAINHG